MRQQRAIADLYFVALGMAAEVVVIVEDEDAGRTGTFSGGLCLCFHLLAIEICCGKAADTSAHDDQVVAFAGAPRLAGRVPGIPIAQLMRIGIGAVMVPAHTHQRRWIVTCCFLGSIGRVVERQRGLRNHGAADGERDSVEEVTARDAAVHSEVLVAFV